MTASGGLYPSLGRYFENMTELAHAGCMSKSRMRDCLDGRKNFTRAEKKAIAANIIARELNRRTIDEAVIATANEAYTGKFDEVYRRKDVQWNE